MLPKPEAVTWEIIRTGVQDQDRSYRINWSYPTAVLPEVSVMVVGLERADSVMGVGFVYRHLKDFQLKIRPDSGQDFQQVNS